MRRAGGAIQNVNLGAAFLESEDRRPRRAARAQHQDLGLLQRDSLLQRAHHTGGVGVKSVKLSILRPHHGVARADFRCVGIGVVQVLEDRFLVRHGDGEAVDGYIAHAAQQIFQRLGMQRKIDAVHILPAQRRIHDGRRERMRDRIAYDAVDSGGCVHLLDAIGVAQLLCGSLTGCGLLIGTDCGESEDAAGSHPEQPADDALLAHAQADQRMAVAKLLQEFHHGHVVVESRGRADNFVEVRGDLQHLFESLFQILGGAKIVVGKNQRGFCPQTLHLFRLALDGALQFDIEQLAARRASLRQNVQLGRQRSLELSAAGRTPARSDSREVGMVLHKALDSGESQRRPGQVV